MADRNCYQDAYSTCPSDMLETNKKRLACCLNMTVRHATLVASRASTATASAPRAAARRSSRRSRAERGPSSVDMRTRVIADASFLRARDGDAAPSPPPLLGAVAGDEDETDAARTLLSA